MKTEFKHNKKRNSGLLYEFLLRKMSEGVIEKNSNKYKTALNIMQRYFSDGMPLCEERKFYDVIISHKGLKKEVANKLLKEIKTKYESYSSSNQKMLEKEKSKLIYEINTRFGQTFYDEYRLKNYKEFATVYILIESWKKNDLKNAPSRVILEETICSMLSSEILEEQTDVIKDATRDKLVYSMALKKLDERYCGKLNNRQKLILKEYVSYSLSGDNERFTKFMNKQRELLTESLSKYDLKNKDNFFLEKFSEIKNKLNDYNFKNCNEDVIEEMMLYHTLIEEIESDV